MIVKINKNQTFTPKSLQQFQFIKHLKKIDLKIVP